MGAVEQRNTAATDMAFDRVIELVQAEEVDYPSHVVFVPADLPDFGTVMLQALDRELPIVVIYPDGRERLIPGPVARA